jgi:hypothetical protein
MGAWTGTGLPARYYHLTVVYVWLVAGFPILLLTGLVSGVIGAVAPSRFAGEPFVAVLALVGSMLAIHGAFCLRRRDAPVTRVWLIVVGWPGELGLTSLAVTAAVLS